MVVYSVSFSLYYVNDFVSNSLTQMANISVNQPFEFEREVKEEEGYIVQR